MKHLARARIMLALVATIAVAWNAASAGNSLDRDFNLSAGTCEAVSPADCIAREPVPWKPDEVQAMRTALADITSTRLGAAVVQRVKANRYVAFQRYRRYAVEQRDGSVRPRPEILAQVQTITRIRPQLTIKSIDFNDLFFVYRGLRDDFSGKPGYSLFTLNLAHELVHATDPDHADSESAEFLRLVDFQPQGHGKFSWTGRSQDERNKLNAFRVEANRLVDEGRFAEAWASRRAFAIQVLKGRLPSTVSVEGPAEAFADLGAHLLVDRTARLYLDPALVSYFERVVMRPQQPPQ